MIERSIEERELDAREVFESCIHCYGGWIVDQEEVSFGEYEDVEYPCHMCCGTGRSMTKAERLACRESRKDGRS